MEESLDTIIGPLQEEVDILRTQEAIISGNGQGSDRFYNPSIEDIKKKYGYLGTKTFERARERREEHEALTEPHDKVRKPFEKPGQCNEEECRRRVYGCEERKLQRMQCEGQPRERTPNPFKADLSPNPPSRYGGVLEPKECNRGFEKYELERGTRPRTKTSDKTPSENRPPERPF